MKKLAISIAFIGAFAAYIFYNNSLTNSANSASTSSSSPVTTVTNSSAANAVTTAANSASNANNSNSAPAATPTPTNNPAVVTKTSGQYADGTYTGSVVDAYYGNVQVRATISGGKLTNIAFLQYPSDRSTSASISKRAMPQLSAEAIQAQSANVNGISGASDTSAAFNQSLANALAQAKA